MDSFVKTSFCVPIKCMNVQRTESYLLPLVVGQWPSQRAFELSCPCFPMKGSIQDCGLPHGLFGRVVWSQSNIWDARISEEMTLRRSGMESVSFYQPSGMCWWVSWQLAPSGRILRHQSFLSTSADALSHQTSHLLERPLMPLSSTLGICVAEKQLPSSPLIQIANQHVRTLCSLYTYLNCPFFLCVVVCVFLWLCL